MMKNIEKLFHDYGYPEDVISNVMNEIETMSYEQVEKLIMPYHDITADSLQYRRTLPFNGHGF
jgi:hypothetical protein